MTFKIASWNVRGFNDASRHKEVKKFLLHEDIKVLGILETKIKAANEKALLSSCFLNWSFLTNSQPTKTGRICVCWDPAFCQVHLIESSTQFILCEILVLGDNSIFKACFVYAENKHAVRKEFFGDMVKISQSQSNVPLVFPGGF